MRRAIYKIPYGLFLIFSFYSCEIINPDEEIPSYIHIDKISLTTNTAQEGSASENITDAWVFINDQFVGGYELPTTFPVLFSGDVNLKVRAGIKNNGATALRVDYSFYKEFEQNIRLYRDSVIELEPVVSYQTDLNFIWLENFDAPTTTLSLTDQSVPFTITNDSLETKEGSGSLKIELTENQDAFYGLSPEMTFPMLGENVYFELDYKGDAFIEVRVLSYLPGNFYEDAQIILFPKQDWNKVYIDLGLAISKYPNATKHQIAILAYNGSNQTNSKVFLDNLKIIYPN